MTTFPDALFQSVIIALHTSDTDVHRPTSIVFSERGCNDAWLALGPIVLFFPFGTLPSELMRESSLLGEGSFFV